jgi:selenocysteine lyase/cysteine desulfurase
MLGMPGIGFLFVDREALPRLRPSLVGWKSTTQAWNFDRAIFELRSDAAKLEEGTPPYALMAGLNAAVGFLLEVGVDAIAKHIRRLVDGMADDAAALGYLVSPGPNARTGILMLQDPRDREREGEREGTGGAPHGQALAAACDAARVRVSLRRGRLRVSPHIYNDQGDREALAAVLRAQRQGL